MYGTLCYNVPYIRKDNMTLEQTQLKVANESLASVKRDSELATLIQGNIDNMMTLVKRIEKLEAEVKKLNEKK